jgi:cytochrome c biogenesis protein CcdA
MDETFLKVLPLAIGATISPTGLLFVMMILSGKDNPKKKALTFIIGSTIFLVLLGLLIFFTYKPIVGKTAHPDDVSYILNIILGLIIILIVIKSVFFKKKDKPKDDDAKHKKPYIVLGFLYMLINISTLIPFIAAIKIIAANKLHPMDDFWVVAAVIIITMLMVSFPVIITYLMPKESTKILGPVNKFMSKHGAQIANVYFLLMAIYLIYAGVAKLFL